MRRWVDAVGGQVMSMVGDVKGLPDQAKGRGPQMLRL